MFRLPFTFLVAILVLASPSKGQNFWGPGISMPVPEGYQAVESGLGWGYAVDLIPSAGAANDLSLVRVVLLNSDRSATEIATEYWGLESPMLGQAGWDLAGPSTEVVRTFLASGEEEDKECSGQLIQLVKPADSSQTAKIQLFAWTEANGSIGVCRTFARGAEQEQLVAEVLDQLSTSGISPTSERRVTMEGITLSIPVTAQCQTQKTANGEIFFGMATAVGGAEVLVGPQQQQLSNGTLDTFRWNAVNRFKLMEDQGAGKRGEQRKSFALCGSELIPITELPWTPTGQAEVRLSIAAINLNDRPVLIQVIPTPGMEKQSRALLDGLMNGKINAGGSRQPNWDAAQFANCFTLIPEGFHSDSQLNGDVLGLNLGKSGMSFNLWLGQWPTLEEESGADALRRAFSAYLERRYVEHTAEQLQESTVEIFPDDMGGFGDRLSEQVPAFRIQVDDRDIPRVYSAMIYNAGRSWIAVMGNTDLPEQTALEKMMRMSLENARSEGGTSKGKLRGLINGRVPLKFPAEDWVVWSTGSGKDSEARLYHQDGFVRVRHREKNQSEANSKDDYPFTLGTMNYEQSAIGSLIKDKTVTMKGLRYIGGKLRHWVGFDYLRDDIVRRRAGSIWLDDEYRYDFMADFPFTGTAEPYGHAEFWTALDQLEIDGVVGSSLPEDLESWPIPYGGAWHQVPHGLGVFDLNGLDSGFAVGVQPKKGDDWTLQLHTFLFDAAKSDEEVFAHLWKNGKQVKWQGSSDPSNAPEATDVGLMLFGAELKGQRRAGEMGRGTPYIVEHYIHRDGDVVRTWSLYGTTLALNSVRPMLDRVRASAELATGVVAGKLAEKPSDGDLGDGVICKLHPRWLDRQASDSNVTWLDTTALSQLQVVTLEDKGNQISMALDSIGVVAGQPLPKLEDLKKTTEPFLLNVHGKLYSANTFVVDEVPAAFAMVPANGKDRVVMVLMAVDLKQDLADVFAGWPASKMPE